MNKSMWNNEAVKAYESGHGVMMVKEPHPHYVPIPQRKWVGLTEDEIVLISADCATQYGKEITANSIGSGDNTAPAHR